MKRPLVSIAVAFVLGELLADYVEYVTIGVIFFALIVISIIWRFLLQKRTISAKKFLYFCIHLSVCIIMCVIGAVSMNRQRAVYDMYEGLEDGTPCLFAGEVLEIKQGEYKTQVLLSVSQARVDEGKTLPDGICVLLDVTDFLEMQFDCGSYLVVLAEKVDYNPIRNDGNFDEKSYYYSNHTACKAICKKMQLSNQTNRVTVLLQNVRTKLCDNLNQVCNQKEASVIQAILYGEKSQLDEEIKQLYSENGIGHILAISGLHMSLIGVTLYTLLRKKYSYLISGVSAGIVMVLFGVMTGFGTSVKRAVFMLLIRIFADLCGRVYDMKNAIAFSMLLLLFQNPYYLYQVSFVLSYASVIVLGFICPECICFLKNREKEHLRVQKVLEYLLPGFLLWYAGLVTSAYYFFQIPTYAILLNLLVIPLLSMLFFSGMVASVLSFISVDIGVFAIGAARFIVDIYIELCNFVETFPYAVIVTGRPNVQQIVLFFVFFGVILILIRADDKIYQLMEPFTLDDRLQGYQKWIQKRQMFLKKSIEIGIVVFGICSLAVIYWGKYDDKWKLAMLDVGQGDCFLIQNTNRTTYLLDAGSSSVSNVAQYRIVPYLKCNGIGRLDYVFLSHPDTDHISGVIEILEKDLLPIGHIVIADKKEYLDEYEEVLQLAKKRDVEILYVKDGFTIREEALCIEVLAPKNCEYSDSNAASMVLEVSYGDFYAYFTGDMDLTAEELLLEELQRADVLKVAHHGSNTSSGIRFIQKISPGLALISAGENNRYGHPHQETLEVLQKIQAKVFNTAQTGAVEIVVDENAEYQVFQTLK